MIVAIHQPAYLPWLGYLSRIAKSDVFVFLDSVQFEKNSFTNRNRIKTPTGPSWLTIPVLSKGHIDKALNEIEIDETQQWRKKHLRSIELNYRRSPEFDQNFSKLEALYKSDTHSLSDLCFSQLQFWMDEFDITTRLVRSSTMPVDGSKSELLLNLCRHLDANSYLSGPLGEGYLEIEKFGEAGIAVEFDHFSHPVYPQLFGDFLPFMSILDYWMNLGSVSSFVSNKKTS